MPKEPQTIFACPNRLSDECVRTYRACFSEIALQRELRFDAATTLATAVANDVIDSYEQIKENTKS